MTPLPPLRVHDNWSSRLCRLSLPRKLTAHKISWRSDSWTFQGSCFDPSIKKRGYCRACQYLHKVLELRKSQVNLNKVDKSHDKVLKTLASTFCKKLKRLKKQIKRSRHSFSTSLGIFFWMPKKKKVLKHKENILKYQQKTNLENIFFKSQITFRKVSWQ